MFRTQLVLVHAKNDGGVKIVAARMRKEHFLRASGNMRLAMLPVAIYARTIQHDIHAQFAPRQIRQRSFMQNTNDIVADKKLLALVANLPCKTPVAGIVFQQMRHACGIRQLVDGHHGNFRPTSGFIQSTNHVTPDATKAINRYAYGHRSPARLSRFR